MLDHKNTNNHERQNFVRRGDYYGPLYDVEHLATFTVGSKLGLLKAEDGIRKLRIMEKSQGVWTMECQLLIDDDFIVVYDKKTEEEVELFPMSLVTDPTSVVSDDRKDIYNNILLFTVMEDTKRKQSGHSSSSAVAPTEMHLFQCVKNHSADIVDEIFIAKEKRYSPHPRSQSANERENEQYYNRYNGPNDDYNPNRNGRFNRNSQSSNSSPVANRNSTNQSYSNFKNSSSHNGYKSSSSHNDTFSVEMEVQILNRCFDDIEKFISRIQNSSEQYKELEKRHKKIDKKVTGEGILGMRAQMPPPQQFVDIYQKLKFSLNLLAKLKSHIHDPNAPELIHFLFTPLALILNISKDHPYKDLSKTIWAPLMTKDSKELLQNCLTSKEHELWMSLGEAWTMSKDEIKYQPHLIGHLDNLNYVPIFYDGWTPNQQQNTDLPDNRTNDSSRGAQNNLPPQSGNSLKYNYQKPVQQNEQLIPPRSRYTSQNQYQDDAPKSSTSVPSSANSVIKSAQLSKNISNENLIQPSLIQNQAKQQFRNGQYQSQLQVQNPNPRSNPVESKQYAPANHSNPIVRGAESILNYEEMKKWAIDLTYRGAKMFEVVHDRMANNDKELTVKAGEILEVLDDKRNWWKLRNFYGSIGHAPVTILRPFDFLSVADNQNREKPGYY